MSFEAKNSRPSMLDILGITSEIREDETLFRETVAELLQKQQKGLLSPQETEALLVLTDWSTTGEGIPKVV